MGALLGAKPPKPPAPKPVTPMPDADSPESQAARIRAMEMARQRSGRASTMLSGEFGSDKLGTR